MRVGYENCPENFGGLEEELSDYARARVAILPAPYDSTVTFGAGTRGGPRAIIEASRNIELYDVDLGRDPIACGVATLPPLEPDARGPEHEVERIQEVVRGLLADGKVVGLLGGEHTVSVGAVRATVERFRELTVVQIDAHLDLRDTYQGSPYSHACVARRFLETAHLVQVGIRSGSDGEVRFVEEEGLRPVYAREIGTGWIEEVVSRVRGKVYVSLDLDGLDPSVCGAVGTPEPGGIGWRDATALIAALGEAASIVGFDVVELAPHAFSAASDVVAAKLVMHLIDAATRR